MIGTYVLVGLIITLAVAIIILAVVMSVLLMSRLGDISYRLDLLGDSIDNLRYRSDFNARRTVELELRLEQRIGVLLQDSTWQVPPGSEIVIRERKP